MNAFKKIIVLLLLVPVSSYVITNINFTVQAQVNVDADGDSLSDKDEDSNGNKIVDDTETDPNNMDTDGDGFGDGAEKKAGTNPIDHNSSPRVLPIEIDANQDGVPDKDYTDAELLANFALVKITSASLGAGAKCNETTAIIENTQLSCKYPLVINANKYTFGADDYVVSLGTSDMQTRCSIEDNGTPQAYLDCKSIATIDSATEENTINLLIIKFNSDVEVLNDALSVNVIVDPNFARIVELTEEQDLALERNCIPVESYKTTTCTFKLPKNTILPPLYSMGIQIEPDGECVQQSTTSIVECSQVPTGDSKGATEVRTTLNSSVNYRALVGTTPQVGHLEEDQQSIPTVKFVTNSELKTIEGIVTGYNGGVELRIYNSNGDIIKSIIGQINLDNTFVPDSMTLLDFQTLPVGSYKAVFESLGLTPNSLKLNYEIVLEILDNTPKSIEEIKKITPSLSRTGGYGWISIFAFGFISLLLTMILIYNRSKFKKLRLNIVLLILFSMLITSLGITENLIEAQAQSVAVQQLTAFGNYNCNPKVVEIGQRINCTMDLINPKNLPANQTILAYVDVSNTTQSFSKPCHPYKGVTWVCTDLFVNSIFQNGNLTNNLPIKLAAISYYNRNEAKLKPTYTTQVVVTVNTIQVANKGTVSTFVPDLNAISQTANVGNDIELRYGSVSPIPNNQNVYFTIRERYSNSVIKADVLATKKSNISFSVTVPTTKAELWRIEACIGTSASTCTVIHKKIEFNIIPNLKAIGVFPETNKNADRVNLVFSCDFTFNSIQACKDSIVSMMAWDGAGKPTDYSGNATANNRANTVTYGLFATEPYKSNKNKFNVMYIDNLVQNFDKRIILDNIQNDGVNVNNTIILRLHNISARSYASYPSYIDKLNLTKSDMNLQQFVTRDDLGIVEQFNGVNGKDTLVSGQVVAHELGHALFGLRDEYIEANSQAIFYGFPNCQRTAASAITDWTAITGLSQNELNGKVDQAYYDWVNDQKKYSFYNFNLANNAATVGKRESDYATRFNVTGGCYGPITGGVYRPTSVSMMSNTSPVFGTVNRARAQDVLDQFSGGTATCNNTATNPPLCNKFPPCNNTATNPPACNNQVVITPPKICNNSATNPPKCDKIPACTNGAINSPTCNKFPPCTNRATNPPACNSLPNNLVAYCPNGTSFDTSIGFCSSSTEVYGPFPRAIVDRCVKNFPKDKTCTSTRMVNMNGINFGVNVYQRDRFLTFRGKGQCAFGTSLSTVVKGGYCYESDTNNPTDANSNANVFGPFTKTVVESCIARKGGNACALNRYSYKFFKQLAQ